MSRRKVDPVVRTFQFYSELTAEQKEAFRHMQAGYELTVNKVVAKASAKSTKRKSSGLDASEQIEAARLQALATQQAQ